ncbi:MAG: hypothetical protein R3C16_00645 [Hyphomonadaceae bacterium]
MAVALLGAAVWFGIAYFAYQGIIDAATGPRRVERREEPKLYNLLENLCISAASPCRLCRIMETGHSTRSRPGSIRDANTPSP